MGHHRKEKVVPGSEICRPAAAGEGDIKRARSFKLRALSANGIGMRNI